MFSSAHGSRRPAGPPGRDLERGSTTHRGARSLDMTAGCIPPCSSGSDACYLRLMSITSRTRIALAVAIVGLGTVVGAGVAGAQSTDPYVSPSSDGEARGPERDRLQAGRRRAPRLESSPGLHRWRRRRSRRSSVASPSPPAQRSPSLVAAPPPSERRSPTTERLTTTRGHAPGRRASGAGQACRLRR